MDLLKNSSKYNDYLLRIKEYKEITDNNKAYALIEGRVNTIYSDLKSGNQKTYYTTIFKAILVLGLGVGLWAFTNGRIFMGIMNLIVMGGAFFYYRYAVKSHVSESKKEQDLLNNSESFESKLLHTMKYLENGIDLKAARIIAVRFIYIAMFSVLMFSASKLLQLENSTSSFVLYGISIMMNACFWFYFFKDDLEELEYVSMELEEYLSSYETSLAEKAEMKSRKQEDSDEIIDFYNFDDDEPIEVIPSPLSEETPQKEYKQLKLEL